MRYLFASFIILLVIAFQSCKSPTAPVTNSSPDTTSQNFTWQKYYFGVNTFNHLDDVAIVNDTSIWAVGSVFLNDSTGNIEGEEHNAVHWMERIGILKE